MTTEDDIYFIADHIAHSITKLAERYEQAGSHLTFDDYVLTNVAVDLQWKYSRYVIQEAFEDRRIKLLLEFYITEEDYRDFETIH
jgi:hypothetical protein